MISVLLPVYNTNPIYLDECIDSIYEQTYQYFEILAVNNGSTDQETLNILDKYSKYHANFKLIQCERLEGRKNLSVALNKGLAHCQYDYVARMDSDDIMHPERLQKQLEYLITNNFLSLVGTQLKEINPSYGLSNLPLIISQDHYIKSIHFINHPTVMFIKQHVMDVGSYPEYPDHIPEDFVLWARMLKAGYKMHNLSEALVYYRNREDNLSMIDSKFMEWHEAIYKIQRGII